jgi:hypothetical protein
MKTARILVAVALLPLCIAATRLALTALSVFGSPAIWRVPHSAWALLIGLFLWVVIYTSMPRPVRAYIFAHELTHALWGWISGARVREIRIGEDRGSTRLSRTNALIILGPYFSPLYTVLVIVAYPLASVFADLSPYHLLWIALIGATWGFHLTFTLSSLGTHQSDIAQMGRFFSYTLIYLVNVMIVALGLMLVCDVPLGPALKRFGGDLAAMGAWIFRLLGAGFRATVSR